VFGFAVGFGLWVWVGIWVGIWIRVRVRGSVRVTIVGIFLGFLGHIFDVTAESCCMGSSQLQWVAILRSKQGIIDQGGLRARLA